jgi:hypothetical protein
MTLKKPGRTITRAAFALAAVVLLLVLVWIGGLALAAGRPPRAGAEDATETPEPTPTVTVCPVGTPEPLWVDPVPDLTDRLTQTVVVYIGNGEAVTVSAETGDFCVQGSFDASAHPARVEITLRPDLIHHLTVVARVRRIEQWGCVYGGYTLRTTVDRYGSPLVIRQEGGGEVRYFPLLFR